jgi:hypothetical protein
MKRFFNSEETALRELEIRKKYAIKRIEKRGDKVIGDNSFVYQANTWERRIGYSIMTDKTKWYTSLGLITQQMVEDLSKMTGLAEIQAEEQRVINSFKNEKLRTIKKNISSI